MMPPRLLPPARWPAAFGVIAVLGAVVTILFASTSTNRWLNVGLATTVLAIIITTALARWAHLPGPRRVLFIGAAALTFAALYGTIEILYWPTLTIRVGVTSFGLIMLGIGMTGELSAFVETRDDPTEQA